MVLVKCELMNLLLILSAIATVVTVAEILKNNGLAVEKSKTPVSLFVIHLCNFVLSSYSNPIKMSCRDHDIHC